MHARLAGQDDEKRACWAGWGAILRAELDELDKTHTSMLCSRTHAIVCMPKNVQVPGASEAVHATDLVWARVEQRLKTLTVQDWQRLFVRPPPNTSILRRWIENELTRRAYVERVWIDYGPDSRDVLVDITLESKCGGGGESKGENKGDNKNKGGMLTPLEDAYALQAMRVWLKTGVSGESESAKDLDAELTRWRWTVKRSAPGVPHKHRYVVRPVRISGSMELRIHNSLSGRSFNVNAESYDSVIQLKRMIEEMTGIPESNQRLSRRSPMFDFLLLEEMNDRRRLCSYNIMKYDEFNLVIAPRRQ